MGLNKRRQHCSSTQHLPMKERLHRPMVVSDVARVTLEPIWSTKTFKETYTHLLPQAECKTSEPDRKRKKACHEGYEEDTSHQVISEYPLRNILMIANVFLL